MGEDHDTPITSSGPEPTTTAELPDRFVGVISDTHGLLRPEVFAPLKGAELIIHAGDIGPPEIIEALETLAPVHVVRGNCDHGTWANNLPKTHVSSFDGVNVYVIHDIGRLNVDPRGAGFAAVIYGHSHEPRIEDRNGVLFLNPGSAGPRRFSLPVSVARLRVGTEGLEAEIVELDV